jgi:FMN reductase
VSTKHVVVLSAGLGQPSSTRLLADRLAEASARALLEQGTPAEFRVIELRDLAHDVTDAMLTGFPSEALAAVLEAVGAADGVVAVTPVFTGSYSGLFKSFFDVLDNTALTGTPVLIGATAGTARHSLVLDHELRPLFSYLRAVVVPTGVLGRGRGLGCRGRDDDGPARAGHPCRRRVRRPGGAPQHRPARPVRRRRLVRGAARPAERRRRHLTRRVALPGRHDRAGR